ncbi:MAG: hypothetical protein RL150_338 [Candidatus Parcubacteria bacterium]|jgi:hypothetical protein
MHTRGLRYIGIFVALSVLCVPAILLAQQNGTPTSEPVTTDNQLYVDEIQIEPGTFAPGDAVRGTFMLYNVSESILSGVTYRVELVKLAVVDEILVISEPLDAGPLSSKATVPAGGISVPFVYTLPRLLPKDGGVGLLIQSYEQGGAPSGYEVVELSVDASSGAAYLPFQAVVSVNGTETYEPLEGPTIQPTEEAVLEVRLVNTLDTATTLTPKITIVRGPTSGGDVAYEKVLDFLTLPAGETVLEQVPLPLDQEPGVYTVLLSFADPTDAAAVAPIEARYIIAGLKPKIEQVRYDTTNIAAANDTLTVHVSFMDVPLNIRVSADGVFQDPRAERFFTSTSSDAGYEQSLQQLLPEGMSARVTLADPNTSEILAQENVGFTGGTAEATVSFPDLTGLDGVYVEVVLLQRGETVDSFGETLILTTRDDRAGILLFWDEHPFISMTGVLVLLVGVWFWWVLARRQQATGILKK